MLNAFATQQDDSVITGKLFTHSSLELVQDDVSVGVFFANVALVSEQVVVRLGQLLELEERLEKALRWYTQSPSFSHFLLPVSQQSYTTSTAAATSSSSGTGHNNNIAQVEPKLPIPEHESKKTKVKRCNTMHADTT